MAIFIHDNEWVIFRFLVILLREEVMHCSRPGRY